MKGAISIPFFAKKQKMAHLALTRAFSLTVSNSQSKSMARQSQFGQELTEECLMEALQLILVKILCILDATIKTVVSE